MIQEVSFVSPIQNWDEMVNGWRDEHIKDIERRINMSWTLPVNLFKPNMATAIEAENNKRLNSVFKD